MTIFQKCDENIFQIWSKNFSNHKYTFYVVVIWRDSEHIYLRRVEVNLVGSVRQHLFHEQSQKRIVPPIKLHRRRCRFLE